MLFKSIVGILTLVCSSHLTSALPLDSKSPSQPEKRAKSYSVVNVDGNSNAGNAGNPGARVTVTEVSTMMEVQTVTATAEPMVATLAIKEGSSTATYVVTLPPNYRYTEMAVPAPTPTPTGAPTVDDDDGDDDPANQKSVQSVRYYDDGMWHTSYPIIDSTPTVVPAGVASPTGFPLLSTLPTLPTGTNLTDLIFPVERRRKA